MMHCIGLSPGFEVIKPNLGVRNVRGDNVTSVSGGIVGKDDVERDASNIIQYEAAGMGLVVGIFFNNFAVLHSSFDIISTNASIKHLLNRMT
jgi:hypothetical protein